MALFLSRFDNKVDRKGRVSVPKQYRDAIGDSNSFKGIVAYPAPTRYPSHLRPPIEACGKDRIEKMAESIDTMNPFDGQHRQFATAFLARTVQLQFDGEGRIMLPESLLEHAGITDGATFAGLGGVFQIWNPDSYAAYEQEAFERVLSEPDRFGPAAGGAR